MITGFNTGSPTDAHEEMLLGFVPMIPADNPSIAVLPIQPAIGCGNMYWAFGADETVQQILYVTEGSLLNVTVHFDPSRKTHSVFAEPLGAWSQQASTDLTEPTIIYASQAGKSVYIQWNVAADFTNSYGDGGQLSNWSLTGLSRFATTRPDSIRKTEAECDVTLTNSGSTRTVTVSLNSQVLCSGTRTGDGSITLSAVNSSGVSGTVAVAYTADVTSGAYVARRYAASYLVQVIDSLSAVVASATVKDNGFGEILSTTLGPINSIGTYTISITPTSDNGIAGSAATTPITFSGAPVAPGSISYVSGTISATIIQFSASATAGATYNVYDVQELGGPTFLEAVSLTHAAGSGNIQVTLNSLSAGSGGERWIAVTALNAGVESTSQKFLLTYDSSGNLVTGAPNVPSLKYQSPPVTSGRTIGMTYLYDTNGEIGVGTEIVTRYKRYSTGSVTTQSAVAMSSIVAGHRTGSIALAVGNNDWYQVSACAQTAGGTNGAFSPWSDPVWCSNAAPPNVSAIVVKVVG